MLYKDLVKNINRQLVNIAFYKEFDQRFSDAPGRSEADKKTRGGLTATEYRKYRELNDLLEKFKHCPYHEGEKYCNVNSVAYHKLYDIEQGLASIPTSTLKDVVYSPFYRDYINRILTQAVQKAAQKSMEEYERSLENKSMNKLRRSTGYQITFGDNWKDQIELLKQYNPRWYKAVDEACKTLQLKFIDTKETVSVKNADDIINKLYAHGGKRNNPFAIAAEKMYEQNAPQHLWMKARNGRDDAFLSNGMLTNSMKAWLNKVPNKAYHRNTFQISPIALAYLRHKGTIDAWATKDEQPTKQGLYRVLDQWMAWVESENTDVRSRDIPKIFIRYIDLSDTNGTWYKSTYNKIKAGIEQHKFKSIAHLSKYIYNSVLASTGEALLYTIGDKTYKYADDKDNQKKANYEYNKIINALDA